MNIDGETIRWEEQSHAQIFRNFWNLFMEKDLQRTIETIELVGIRTSDSEYFVAKNGNKKKNIFVKNGYYIYTHLNPIAMQKVYQKFLTGWEETYIEPKGEIIHTESEERYKEPETGEKLKLKNIYKKSLAMALVRLGHDLHHTMRNRNNPRYQVFVFEDTPQLIEDIISLNKREG